jgi:hypothetical protein
MDRTDTSRLRKHLMSEPNSPHPQTAAAGTAKCWRRITPSVRKVRPFNTRTCSWTFPRSPI